MMSRRSAVTSTASCGGGTPLARGSRRSRSRLRRRRRDARRAEHPGQPVRLEEFGAEAPKRNLEDLQWDERTAGGPNRRRARPPDAAYRLDARRAAEFACVPTSSPPATRNYTSWSPAMAAVPSPPRSPVRVAGCMTSSRWSTEDAGCGPGQRVMGRRARPQAPRSEADHLSSSVRRFLLSRGRFRPAHRFSCLLGPGCGHAGLLPHRAGHPDVGPA